jgi:uncharacterized membrane protein YfcA
MDVTLDWPFAVAAAATAFAGIVRGFAGFGSSMLLAPSLSALYTPAVAIPMLGIMELGVAAQLLPKAVGTAKWRTVGILAGAAALGIPLGAYALRTVPTEIMRWIISAAIIAAICLIVLGLGRKGEARLPGTLSAGALSGLSAGATGMGGPPIVLYYLAGQDPAAEIRGSLICFFMLTSIMQLGAYAANGLLTVDNGMRGLVMLPIFIAGAFAGSHLFGQTQDRTYRRIALALVAIVAIVSLLV